MACLGCIVGREGAHLAAVLLGALAGQEAQGPMAGCCDGVGAGHVRALDGERRPEAAATHPRTCGETWLEGVGEFNTQPVGTSVNLSGTGKVTLAAD